jgi:nucleotide-binding universal stress UspA family protein
MIRSILVPLDGSAFGEHALPLAASLARKAGAMLHLVHVHQPAPPVPAVGFEMVDLFDLHLREDELAYLADVSRRVHDAADVPVKTALLTEGDVVRSLRDYASTNAVEQVVMATHGRGAMGRWWLGAVADELARTMPRPVVLIRPEEDGKTDLGRKVELNSIVVALDGTPLAEQVIEPAIRLGEPFGAALALVRVCSPVLRSSYLPEGTTFPGLLQSHLEEMTAMQRKAEQECREYLNKVAANLAERGLCVSTHVPVEEEPADGILAVAKERRADLIAMETHGRRGLSRLFMGSVADRVVRGGGVPVLLNRPAN